MVHALAVVLIAVGLMNSSADLRAQPQPKAGLWTWTDRYGKTRSRGDLEKILETWKHKTMGHCQGAKEISEFTGILGNDNDLRGAHLRDADLRHVWLNCVDLSGSGLYNANLSGNELFGTNFSHANLSSANLSFADLSCPFKALDDTFFTGDEIGGSYLGHCKGANLSDADLTFANLSHADLTGVDLSDANLLGTNVAYAIFEPTTGPQAAGIAYAVNLGLLVYRDNPAPLMLLRRSAKDNGFAWVERQLTAALRRHNSDWWEMVFFDWTCEYGANAVRPIWLVVVIWLMCTPLYWGSLHQSGRSGLYLSNIALDRQLGWLVYIHGNRGSSRKHMPF